MIDHNLRTVASAAFMAGFAIFAYSAAWAQNFPAKPVRIIVPFAPGGANDVTSRALANAAQRHLGQPIVVENIAGGGGLIAANAATQAQPDGYTTVTSVLSILLAPYQRKATYDPTTDFTFIIGVTGFTFGVVVRNDAPWRTFEEFLADARANPGKINYAASGVGTIQHLMMERIAKQQGIKWVHVPFRGDPEAINALLAGNIHAVGTGTTWAPQVDAGQLRLLVTWGTNRTKNWPNVPTLRETGVNMAIDAPYGISGPRGMDPKVVRALHDAFKKGMEDRSFAATLAQLNEFPLYLNSEDYRDYALKQLAEWRRIIDELGLKPE
jgi:tripartite-type tricarboxylate transporter receptor subunit TctC